VNFNNQLLISDFYYSAADRVTLFHLANPQVGNGVDSYIHSVGSKTGYTPFGWNCPAYGACHLQLRALYANFNVATVTYAGYYAMDSATIGEQVILESQNNAAWGDYQTQAIGGRLLIPAGKTCYGLAWKAYGNIIQSNNGSGVAASPANFYAT
jgi:hypothetical protein